MQPVIFDGQTIRVRVVQVRVGSTAAPVWLEAIGHSPHFRVAVSVFWMRLKLVVVHPYFVGSPRL